MKKIHILGSAAAILAFTACTPDNNFDRQNVFEDPAGSQLGSGGFGSATMNNMLAHNGSLSLKMVKELTRKFQAETPATINFEFNSSALDAAAQASLRQQAEWIKAHPNITFRVFGHTDKVGSNAYNKRLGLRRARAAVNYMISQGVSRKKLEAVVSFGETRPLVLTEAANRDNRRTVTEVKGFFRKSEEGELDGKYAVRIYNAYTGATQRIAAPSVDGDGS